MDKKSCRFSKARDVESLNIPVSASFEKSFVMGRKTIGSGHPPYIIAEGGVAHFGDFDLAVRLAEMAINAGADAFKLQAFDVERMISARAIEWRERLRPRNLGLEQMTKLRDLCVSKGVDFVLTIHDESRLHWLVDLDVSAVKIGSGEKNNPDFVRKLAALGKPVILSTGMYSEQDVNEALEAVHAGGCSRLALLHCNTSYPTPDEDVNLLAMDHLKRLFPGPVGYSDHTPDELAVIAATALGACVIEKHITILRDVPNAQDWKVSADTENFPGLISSIRRAWSLRGHGLKEPSPSEATGRQWALKSLVVSCDLPAGTVLQQKHLDAKRPANGIPPNRIQSVIGKRTRIDLKTDDPVKWEDIS